MAVSQELKQGKHVKVSILHSDREIEGKIEAIDSISFNAFQGKIVPYISIKEKFGKTFIIFLTSIGSIEILPSPCRPKYPNQN